MNAELLPKICERIIPDDVAPPFLLDRKLRHACILPDDIVSIIMEFCREGICTQMVTCSSLDYMPFELELCGRYELETCAVFLRDLMRATMKHKREGAYKPRGGIGPYKLYAYERMVKCPLSYATCFNIETIAVAVSDKLRRGNQHFFTEKGYLARLKSALAGLPWKDIHRQIGYNFDEGVTFQAHDFILVDCKYIATSWGARMRVGSVDNHEEIDAIKFF